MNRRRHDLQMLGSIYLTCLIGAKACYVFAPVLFVMHVSMHPLTPLFPAGYIAVLSTISWGLNRVLTRGGE